MATRFEKYQIESLELAFEESEHLTKERKIDLARVTGLDMEQITSWFNRKRACKRARESKGELEQINAVLKQSLQELHSRKAKLQMELKERKRREAELEAENELLKHRLTVLEGDSQLDSVIR
ncbi:hypothetical protein Salat_1584800 [Sesamum alatum]|uniref:Homeobox-leucine zipper protein n=1 Tax=Sesamum alatum TaxID=300844 RepID=A0AAE1YEI6_9LAMI|nr:hypothetical protein Salat_1584800 [Sesamum alatum]